MASRQQGSVPIWSEMTTTRTIIIGSAVVVVALMLAIAGTGFASYRYMSQVNVMPLGGTASRLPEDPLGRQLRSSSVPALQRLGAAHISFRNSRRNRLQEVERLERLRPPLGWRAVHEAIIAIEKSHATAQEADLATMEFAAAALGAAPTQRQLDQVRASAGYLARVAAADRAWRSAYQSMVVASATHPRVPFSHYLWGGISPQRTDAFTLRPSISEGVPKPAPIPTVTEGDNATLALLSDSAPDGSDGDSDVVALPDSVCCP
ncbi:MAG: hypothetical protein JWN72_2897 [Thermoleophilia bacterium]|nr:hypothetical protein [Thermoleophilia bacterium]